jgi:spore coat protein U-like protein
MKKSLVILAAMAFVIAMVGGAYAAPPLDVQVDVTGSVTQKCVVTSNGALTITIDPASASATQAFTATQPQAKCTKTKGTATAAVSATSTNSFALKGTAGEADIPYTFTYNHTVVGNGFGSGADVNFNIAGSVAQGDAQTAEYGSYTDTVTLTLTY